MRNYKGSKLLLSVAVVLFVFLFDWSPVLHGNTGLSWNESHALPEAERSADHWIVRIPSKDGTIIAVECAGEGPTLLIVHGGTGDRARWIPMFPLLSSRLTICAMDRRGHGESGDSTDYSLDKEAEDIAAVVNSRRGTVYALGHSYGGVAAL
jgi:pimeloyl-ACP methyl ester carboxylesterase